MKKIVVVTLITTTIFGFTACSKPTIDTSTKANSSMSSSKKNAQKGLFASEEGHKVKGNVKIKDGKIYLKGFSTDEGPDLHILLSNGKRVEGALELGEINLTQTEQEFPVSNEDISKYDTVLIYCNKAHELFGSTKI